MKLTKTMLTCPLSLYNTFDHLRTSEINCVETSQDYLAIIIDVVTLETFYLGKLDLLTVYLGKPDFLSVTDFSLRNLTRRNFIVWGLDMSREQ